MALMDFVFATFVALALLLIGKRLHKIWWLTRIPPKKKLITERLVKLLFNPFDGDGHWWWTRFNPKTRTFEWIRAASDGEVALYKDVVLSPELGDQILALGDNKNG